MRRWTSSIGHSRLIPNSKMHAETSAWSTAECDRIRPPEVSSMSKRCVGLAIPLLLCFCSGVFAQQPRSCERLTALTLPQVTIVSATTQAAGAWTFGPGTATRHDLDAPSGSNAATVVLPAFCRVAMTLTPSSDSTIQSEVWLPVQNWNEKFEAVGNGGWAGIISYAAMAYALHDGYANASTDTGHKGANALFAIGHPE